MSTTITARVSAEGPSPPLAWSLGGMQFDAWLYLAHNSSLTITQHPVETGAAITDHSYVNPRRWTFNVGMTDVIGGKVAGDSQSRSVNAYNQLVQMQAKREPLPLVSKYGVYDNVLIADVSAADNYQTMYAGRFTITLQEIIVVGRTAAKVSANPQATEETNRGQVSGQEITKPAQEWLIDQGISTNSLIRFGLNQFAKIIPNLPLAQVQLIWETLVNLNPQALINLTIIELQRLFPQLTRPEAQLVLNYLQAEINKRLKK